MFVVKLLRAKAKPDTYNVTNSLLRYKLEVDAIDAFRNYHQADSYAKFWKAVLKETKRESKIRFKRLARIKKEIKALQEEERQLQEAEKLAAARNVGLVILACIFKRLRDSFLSQAETLHNQFNTQFTAVTAIEDNLEDWSELAIQRMLKQVPAEFRDYYTSVSDPAHRFLLLAARAGHEPPFRELAKRNIDPNITARIGRVVIMSLTCLAAFQGHKRIVQTLLLLGADVPGTSPLMSACAGGHIDVVRLLLSCENNGAWETDGRLKPLLPYATSKGRLAVVEQLLGFTAPHRWQITH